MDFTKDTLVKDILAKYPDLKAKLIQMDPASVSSGGSTMG